MCLGSVQENAELCKHKGAHAVAVALVITLTLLALTEHLSEIRLMKSNVMVASQMQMETYPSDM